MWDPGRSHECVALRDVELDLRIGAHESERGRRQPVRVDVELYRRRRGLDPADPDYLDYDRVYRHLVDEWPGRGHVDLLELWAEDLVAFCLADERVEACRVRIRKPAVYGGRAVPEVEVYRRRGG